MATNLVDLVMGYLTPDVVNKAASYVGEAGPATQKAVASIVPTEIAALANLGSTEGGLQQIVRMLDLGKYDGSGLSNLGSLFAGGAATQEAVGAGKGMIESLFGSKLGGVTDLIARSTGIRGASITSLMALIGPVILSVLGRQRSMAGGSVAALGSLLGDQKSFLSGMLPAGLASMLGWPALASGVSELGSGAAAATARAGREVAAVTSRRPAWLIPLAAIAALILIVLAYLWSSPPVSQVTRQATRKLAELQLPGGPKISVPDGAFNFSLATWLAGTDTAVPKRFVFDDLNFETATTRLTPESRPTVETLVAILKAYPAVTVGLEGHTDSTGDAAANKKLSLDRAVAVKESLVSGGIADARVATAGLGSEKPIASNDTEDGRAKNRRLELVVVKR
jgi:OmpA-OmpF porin, OOP family